MQRVACTVKHYLASMSVEPCPEMHNWLYFYVTPKLFCSNLVGLGEQKWWHVWPVHYIHRPTCIQTVFFLILPLAPGTKLYGTLRFNPVPYPRLNRGEKTRQDVVLWGVVAFIYHTGTITGVIANLLSNKK